MKNVIILFTLWISLSSTQSIKFPSCRYSTISAFAGHPWNYDAATQPPTTREGTKRHDKKTTIPISISKIHCNRRQNIHVLWDAANPSSSSSFPSIERLEEAEEANSKKKLNKDYEWSEKTIDIGVPALIAMISDPLLSLMDTAFVGRLGSIPLAALGACTSVFHLAFHVFRATTTATTSLVAASLARNSAEDDNNNENINITATTQELDSSKKEGEAAFVIDTSIKLSLVMGGLVATTLFFGATAILSAMGIGVDSDLFGYAMRYLRIRALVAPAVLFINVAEGAFRGYGITTIPLVASLTAAAMNIILDPLLMFPLRLGVSGASAATAVSQLGAASVYIHFLRKRNMLKKHGPLPNKQKQQQKQLQNRNTQQSRTGIITTILGANFAMFTKQGSLLFGWAYATARATRIGSSHVAAHQVALSFWLLFALILEGAAVSAQVLMSKCHTEFKTWTNMYQNNTEQQQQSAAETPNVSSNNDFWEGSMHYHHRHHHQQRQRRPRTAIHSLTKYMTKLALIQGLLSMLCIRWIGKYCLPIFATDPFVQSHLQSLVPHLAFQQLLVSLTLVMESLAAGANKFQLLAIGTAMSTVWSIKKLRDATSIVEIWSGGIVIRFLGRLITAVLGVMDVNGAFDCVRRRRRRQ